MNIRDLLFINQNSALLDRAASFRTVRDKSGPDQSSDQVDLLIPEGAEIKYNRLKVLRIGTARGEQLPRAVPGLLCLFFAVHHLGQAVGKDFLDLVQLLPFLLLVAFDLFHRNKGEQLHALDDILVADISPVLVEIKGAGLIGIQPHGTLRGLAHLLSLRIGKEGNGHGLGIRILKLSADQLPAGQHVRPLVVAAELHLAAVILVKHIEVICLHDHIVEFEEGQSLLPSLLVASCGQHLIDRKAGPDFAQEIYIIQVQKPVGIIDRNGLPFAFSEIDKSAHLLTEALTVVLNRLDRHHGTGIGSAGGIPHHARAAAQKRDRPVARHLQSLHQAKGHKMSHMKTVGGRIESDVKGCLTVIDHLTDLFRIRQLREKASRLKLLINTHLSCPFLISGLKTSPLSRETAPARPARHSHRETAPLRSGSHRFSLSAARGTAMHNSIQTVFPKVKCNSSS